MANCKWLTIKQAASYLGIGEPTLYRWLKDGKITCRKVGDSTRFLQRDLDAFVKVLPAEGDYLNATERCSACQGSRLVKGRMQSTGKVYFKPDKTKFWTWKESQVPTETWMCMDCGALTHYGMLSHLEEIHPGTEELDPQD